jgi:hypothetical protein
MDISEARNRRDDVAIYVLRQAAGCSPFFGP